MLKTNKKFNLAETKKYAYVVPHYGSIAKSQTSMHFKIEPSAKVSIISTQFCCAPVFIKNSYLPRRGNDFAIWQGFCSL